MRQRRHVYTSAIQRDASESIHGMDRGGDDESGRVPTAGQRTTRIRHRNTHQQRPLWNCYGIELLWIFGKYGKKKHFAEDRNPK